MQGYSSPGCAKAGLAAGPVADLSLKLLRLALLTLSYASVSAMDPMPMTCSSGSVFCAHAELRSELEQWSGCCVTG